MRGMFGELSIVTTDTVRSLKINNQTQGSVFLDPSATVVDPSLSGPGPISASAYPYGWLVAGTQNPSGDGIMIGLGSSAGACQFLHCFPEATLVVVEIDSVLTQLALKNFPLIEYYLNKGRLHIEIADASDYLKSGTEQFAFGFADAYTGRGNKHVVSYHNLLRHRCKEVYFNIIDSVDHKLVNETKESFRDLGMPLKWGMRAIPPEMLDSPYVHTANWIVTTADVDWNLVDSFEPFKGLDGPEVDWARICWNGVIGSPFEL